MSAPSSCLSLFHQEQFFWGPGGNILDGRILSCTIISSPRASHVVCSCSIKKASAGAEVLPLICCLYALQGRKVKLLPIRSGNWIAAH